MMSRKIQILLLVVFLLLLSALVLNLAFYYPEFEFISRPVAGFLISAIVGSIFRELRERKKNIYPKIPKRKP